MAGQRGLADTHFSALSQFVDPMAQAGKFAMDYGTRIRADEKEAGLAKERADDRLLRKEENAQQQANWAKSFGLQQSAEDRAKTEQAAKEATRQAYGQYGQLLSSPNQTQAQVTEMSKPGSMLANVQAKGGVLTPAQESKLLAQYGADVGTNKGSLTQQRQLLQEQAPVSALYGVGADGQMTTRGDIDVSQQEALKQTKLSDINNRIEQQLGRDQALSLAQLREKGDNDRLSRTLKAKEREAKEPKFQPETYTYTKDGKQYQVTARDQSQLNDLAVRFGQKDDKGKLLIDKNTGLPKNFSLGQDVSKDYSGSADKSVYASPRSATLADKWGSYDSGKILSMAETLRKANKNMSSDTALGIVEDVASGGLTDKITVGGVMDRALDLGYTGKILKR